MKIKRLTIKKTPVKVKGYSIEGGVAHHIAGIAEDKGYSQSAYVNKILKDHAEDMLTAEAIEAQDE